MPMYKRFRTDLAAEQRELTEGAGSLKGVRASSCLLYTSDAADE